MMQMFIAVIFYIFSVLYVFWQPLIDNFGSIQWDAVSVHFYNLFFSSEIWSKGIFPSWSPYIFGGFPQIADLQVAFFYPVNLLVSAFAVWTPELVMYQIVLHYFLAGFFCFLLARYLSKNFWFSVAAGSVYFFGGFMAAHASHIGMQNTATWLPLVFLFLFISLKKAKIFFAALAGLFLGIAILAGHFQMSLYIAYAVAFYFVFDTVWVIVGGADKKNTKKIFLVILRKVWLISIVYIIAFLVSAIQLLPTYELTRQSNRAKISPEMSQTESLNPQSLKSLVEPNYNNVSYGAPYSGPWDRTQNYLYLGITIIILAILGIFSGVFYRDARKMTFFWLALLIISLLYSFGEFGFLQKYFYRFAPFFDKIRAPANMMLLFNLSVIGLASVFFRNADKFFKKNENLKIIDGARQNQNIFHFIKKTFFKNGPVFLGIAVFLAISMEILPAVRLNTLLYSRQKTGEVVAAPPIASRITEEYSRLGELDKFRIFKVPGMETNLTQLLHIFAFDGYNPLSLKRHSAYIDAMVKDPKLIDLAGIKYLPCEFIAERANSLEKTGDLCVNDRYFKFAFFVGDFAVAKDEADALQRTQEADPEKMIVLEEIPEQKNNIENYSGEDLSAREQELSVLESRPGFWRFSASADKDTFLFLSQANYPGWSAEIDGKPAKIYQADYLFQGIFVPRGKHTITLQYGSRPLINGAILTIIGLLLVLSLAVREFCLRKK